MTYLKCLLSVVDVKNGGVFLLSSLKIIPKQWFWNACEHSTCKTYVFTHWRIWRHFDVRTSQTGNIYIFQYPICFPYGNSFPFRTIEARFSPCTAKVKLHSKMWWTSGLFTIYRGKPGSTVYVNGKESPPEWEIPFEISMYHLCDSL